MATFECRILQRGGDGFAEDMRITQFTERFLDALIPIDDLARGGDDPNKRFEQVPDFLAGNPRQVRLLLLADRIHDVESGGEDVEQGSKIGRGLRGEGPCGALFLEKELFEASFEVGGQGEKRGFDALGDAGVASYLCRIQPLGQPSMSDPVAGTEVVNSREPGELDLEITADPCGPGEPAEVPGKPGRNGDPSGVPVASKQAADSAQGHAKIVKRLIVLSQAQLVTGCPETV
jgi:hypothetical protein